MVSAPASILYNEFENQIFKKYCHIANELNAKYFKEAKITSKKWFKTTDTQKEIKSEIHTKPPSTIFHKQLKMYTCTWRTFKPHL